MAAGDSVDGPGKRQVKVGAGLVAGLLMLVAACASAPSFTPPPAVSDAFLREMAVTKAEDGIRVSATIPSREEARSIFGIDLREQGIQPLWLEIENGREGDIYFLPTGLDPESTSRRWRSRSSTKARLPTMRRWGSISRH